MSHLLYLHSGNFDSLVTSFTPELLAKRLKGRPGLANVADIASEVRRAGLDYSKINETYHPDLDLAIRLLDRKQEGRPLCENGISEAMLNAYKPRFMAQNADNARYAMLFGKRPGLPSLRKRDDFEFFLLTPHEVVCLADIVANVADRTEELECKARDRDFFLEDFFTEIVHPVTTAANKAGSFLFGRWG